MSYTSCFISDAIQSHCTTSDLSREEFFQRIDEWVTSNSGYPHEHRDTVAKKIKKAYDRETTELVIRELTITSLPDLSQLTNLKILDISENKLEHLPAFPENLRTLYARGNELKHLPDNLPVDLQELDVSHNELKSLTDSLPAGLHTLYVWNNELKSLPVLPVSLKKLDASYNELNNLPDNFPSCLQEIDVSYNELISLPVLPACLQSIDTSGNKLIEHSEMK